MYFEIGKVTWDRSHYLNFSAVIYLTYTDVSLYRRRDFPSAAWHGVLKQREQFPLPISKHDRLKYSVCCSCPYSVILKLYYGRVLDIDFRFISARSASVDVDNGSIRARDSGVDTNEAYKVITSPAAPEKVLHIPQEVGGKVKILIEPILVFFLG